jgi:salicylate hydroxylase
MANGQREPALIAGGGIGGLAAALALAQAGRRSIIVERRAEWSEAGAGIQISPNGVRALQRLGVAPKLEPSVASPREIVVRDAATARVLQRLPLGDWISARHGAPYWLAHRRDLQAALVAAVEAEPLIGVVHGFEVTSYEVRAEQVLVHARDGRSIEGAMLVGADGVFSRVRQQLFAPRAPRFSGRTAARTVVTAPDLANSEAFIAPDATGVWLAPGAHVVHYPVRAGREIAVVVVRTETWKAHGWSEPVGAQEMEAALESVAPAFARALGKGRDWRRWALFETEPLARWSQGNVTILGDAAHPTLPFLAQGGVLALEDAVTLGAFVGRAFGYDEIAASLAAYETARLDRSRRIVAAARRNGLVFHLSGPAAFARNAAMRMLSGDRVMAGYDWVYGWRPP